MVHRHQGRNRRERRLLRPDRRWWSQCLHFAPKPDRTWPSSAFFPALVSIVFLIARAQTARAAGVVGTGTACSSSP